MIRVLLCDDHRIVREGLKQVLADDADVSVCAEASTGAEALALADRFMASGGLDVVLLDIAMPEGDGLDVLQALRRNHPGLPVLMLSTYPEKQYAVRCIRLGAAGYLHKSADPDDMLVAVRKAAAGGRYLTDATAQALAGAVGRLDARTGSVRGVGAGSVRGSGAGAVTEQLSHREHQVFRLLTSGRSVSEIGAQLKLAPNTVSTYRARILEKTGARNDVELALLSERHGPASLAT
jgi:two-component system, NarL family, invasion response regulator UvrY